MEDLFQCRQAELEFLSSAYTEDEVWWDYDDEKNLIPHIHRILQRALVNNDGDDPLVISVILDIVMPPKYPLEASLQVNGRVEEGKTSKKLLKRTFDALPALVSCCRQTAESLLGSEAVFAVFSAADDWIIDLLDEQEASSALSKEELSENTSSISNEKATAPLLLGRRLIYSHHIIATQKRVDLRRLSGYYNLTGYVKIGWPGIIIIEGREEDCQRFYDEIRQWAWQYLVVRGEMQQEARDSHDLESQRLFTDFIEVGNMSIVADHCRAVGLEALFRTSMKQYGSNDKNNGEPDEDADGLYGALIHVDHFNDAKSYRKWLCKTSNQLGIGLLVKECYGHIDPTEGNGGDSSNCKSRPIIVVALVGDPPSVSGMLKKWRTMRVDVDSRGKPCLERQMKVLVQEKLERRRSIDRLLDWDSLHADDHRTITREELVPVIESIGGKTWVDAFEDLFSK